MADYKIENIYQGGDNSFNPEYGIFSGYRAPAGNIGMATDPRTANVLQEMSTKLNPGQKQIELSLIQPDIFESVPKQHLKEINRLSKLTGVDVSVHGPLIEASGISQQGGFDESAREGSERQISFAVERAHEVNPDGNVPVTFHSTVQVPSPVQKKTEKEGVVIDSMPIINQETGQMAQVKRETRFRPKLEGGEIVTEPFNADEMVDNRNHTEWDNALTQLVSVKDRADRMVDDTWPLVQGVMEQGINPDNLNPNQKDTYNRFQNAYQELGDINQHLNALFNRAYTYGSDGEKEYLKGLAKEFQKVNRSDPKDFSRSMQELMAGLRPSKNLNAPQIFRPVEEFAIEKSGETFGNAAFNVYKKAQKENWKGTPIISIENPPAGTTGLNRGEDLKNLVKSSQAQFVKKAVAEGMSKGEAEAQAKKLIGVTWDVGHINMIRKYGFSEEDVVKEAEKVAPYLKHVHLSDNFGFEHTELPMGMGNVPLKEIMGKLGEKGFEAKKVIEAGNWWQHFKSPPFQETLEAFGSPIYSMKMAPYWNQALGYQQGYSSGYGQMLPQVNYDTFGAGFSQLPMELGGQRQSGQGGRMSGRPME